ncbi:MAG: hypothetical protein ACKPCQ_03295, partial [Dolichospermum sp.]
KFILTWATRSRGYTDETHLRGFRVLDLTLTLVHAGGLCLCSLNSYLPGRLEVVATQTKPTFVGSESLI